jgi:hypothetical protein
MAIWSFLLKLNGVDIQSYGMGLVSLRGPWDGPSQSFDEVGIPQKDGTMRTTLEPTIGPLDFAVTAELRADTSQLFEDAVDTLKAALYSPAIVTILVGNQETRQRTGTARNLKVSPYFGEIRGGQVEFTVHCENPIAYDTTATTVSGAVSTDIATPLGTWRSWPVVTVTTGTNPLLTYKNSSGATIATLQLTGVGTFVVDMNAKTILLGGVRHDEALTAGDFFALKPADAPTGSPSIRTSSGSISITYNKAYA